MAISVQLSAFPYCTLCEQYYAITPLTQDMHKVNHKQNPRCGTAKTSRQNSNGLNAICIAFIPINCALVIEKEGIMNLKMSGTCHPVTEHDKAHISCVLVGLSNNNYYYYYYYY